MTQLEIESDKKNSHKYCTGRAAVKANIMKEVFEVFFFFFIF